MNALLDISPEKKIPIYMQIVESITDAIRRGIYKMGDRIYSINELSNEYFLARDTVQKAYNILHERGVITSVKGKGYYVNNTNLDVTVRVLLLFSKIGHYKKQIYNGFVHALGSNAVVDLKIHHFNTALFSEQLKTNLGNYDYFVVMPHFYDDPAEALKIIKTIPEDKLIILDTNISTGDVHLASVYQDYQKDIAEALEQGLDLLSKYDKLILVFPSTGKYSPEIIHGFRKFCMQNNFKNEVLDEISEHTAIHAKEAYIVIEESDLCNLIKTTRELHLQPGKDVGIISYNDSPLKELVLDGITVITTDHTKMGETAARLILENSKEKIKNPFVLIRRNSL